MSNKYQSAIVTLCKSFFLLLHVFLFFKKKITIKITSNKLIKIHDKLKFYNILFRFLTFIFFSTLQDNLFIGDKNVWQIAPISQKFVNAFILLF